MASSPAVVLNFRDVPNNTKKHWWVDNSLRWNMLHCMGLCGTLFFNGYDSSLFNGLQSIDQWHTYFDNPSSNTLGLMNSAGFLPGIIAAFVGDRVSNFFGRRVAIWSGTLLVIAGVSIISEARNVGMFCGGRVIVGFGTSMALATAPSLLQEIAHPRFRAQMSAFYTAIYYVAAILSAAACLGCLNLQGEKAWRIPCFIQLVGPGLTLAATSTMPESPRWLAKNGKADEARRVLVKYHANGKEDDELVAYEYREIMEALEDEDRNCQTKYTDLFRGPGNRHRLFINVIVSVGTNWVGNGIISYYLSPILNSLGITSSATQLGILIGLHGWNLIVSVLASLYVEQIGRRPLWLSSTGGMLIFIIFVMGFSGAYKETGNLNYGTAAIPFLFLFYGAYDLAWTPLAYSYPVEIYPFSLRTKGQAVFISVQTLAVSVNTWVNPVALEALQWKYYGVYVAINAILLVTIWFTFPETKNRTIEEIGIIFDKSQALGGVQASYAGDAVDKTSVPSVSHLDRVSSK